MSDFSVSTFLSKGLANGGLRANRFKVSFNFPKSVSANTNRISLLTKSTTIPAPRLGVTEVKVYGSRTLSLAGDQTLTQWSTTLILDSIDDYHAFIAWQNIAMGMQNNKGANNPQDYLRDYEVTLYNRDNTPVHNGTFVLEDGFPSTVGALRVSYDSTNTILECDVEFAYNNFKASSTL